MQGAEEPPGVIDEQVRHLQRREMATAVVVRPLDDVVRLLPWERRKSAQAVAARSGEGSMPWFLRISQMVEAAIAVVRGPTPGRPGRRRD
ncbi:hypothetical protein GCM10010508_42110 [Streptomyces naganishii JCM 4654]|uniref:Uncharacterized protein n=1 Tax=Streptomyces naganishii JCM 4654 TaxID=1306179 RepID=A0A918Y6T6_9ACTN|nr:hypothetical protein GCM10010508_42110 [Streptomyces naganishii JCM 4654]